MSRKNPAKLEQLGTQPRSKYQLFSSLTSDEYALLKRTIAERGVDVPTVWDKDGNLLDGEHRERACREVGINCPREVRHFDSEADKWEFILRVNCRRRQLDRKQKRKLIASYLKVDPAISDNTLADLIGGISKNTVQNVRHGLEKTRQIDKLTELRGKDGKVRPREYKRIITNTPKELRRAQVAIRQLPESCNGDWLDITTASRRAKRNVKRQELQGEIIEPTPDDAIRLYHCPFQEIDEHAGILPGSVQAFVLDIPYGEDFLPQLEVLAAMARRDLAAGGILVCYVGTMYLNRVLALFDKHLAFVPPLCSVWEGDANLLHKYGIVNHWKPIIAYSQGAWKARSRFSDVIRAQRKEKDLHPWQQSLADIERLVACVTRPGGLVVDCVGGSFTTAIACRNLGRRFIGCDIDKQCVLRGQRRLVESSAMRPRRAIGDVGANTAVALTSGTMVTSQHKLGIFRVQSCGTVRTVAARSPRAAALSVLKGIGPRIQATAITTVRDWRETLLFDTDTLLVTAGYEPEV